MSALLIGLLTLACVTAGMAAGMVLRSRLPDHHLQAETKDVVKTATGLIATLVALVIGLLVGSAKNSLDATNNGFTQLGAKALAMDRVLVRCGPQANQARELLQLSIRTLIERIWPTGSHATADIAAVERSKNLEKIDDAIRSFPANTDAERQLQSQALQLSSDILVARWQMIEQMQSQLSPVLLVVLIFWLTTLFLGFGLLAPANAMSIGALLICAISISGAVFLILEMNHPFEGIIKVSAAPLEKALALMVR